jgi:hypothetical protein
MSHTCITYKAAELGCEPKSIGFKCVLLTSMFQCFEKGGGCSGSTKEGHLHLRMGSHLCTFG